jgi:hypothetical protein
MVTLVAGGWWLVLGRTTLRSESLATRDSPLPAISVTIDQLAPKQNAPQFAVEDRWLRDGDHREA